MAGAKAEAEAVRLINTAAQESQNNPLLLQLKSLEVEKARVEKWDGRYPQWWMAGGAAGGPNLQFQVPLPTAAVLFGSGLIGLLGWQRKRLRKMV